MPFMSPKAGLSRRNFIGFMLCAGISGLFSKSVFAAIGELETAERSLSLYNPHTKDSFTGVKESMSPML